MEVNSGYVVGNHIVAHLPIQERETDLLKFTLTKRGPWYYINAWGRTSIRAEWKQVWFNRVHISYLHALNEFNDTGAALADWKSKLSFA